MEIGTRGATGEQSTRDRVRVLVAEHGPVTTAEVAEHLGLTAAAVRRHLDHLLEAGAVDARVRPASGRGRPSREFVISAAGLDQVPGAYDRVAADALHFLAANLGEDALAQFARSRFDGIESEAEEAVEAAGADPMARAQALADVLTRHGFAATVHPVGSTAGVQLCQGQCPVRQVAAEFKQFCEVEAEVISRLLGIPATRLATLADGEHVCTTFIPTIPVRPRPEDAAAPTDQREERARA